MFKIVYSESMVQPHFTKWYKNRKVAQNAANKLNARYAKAGHGLNAFTVYSQDEYVAATEGKGEWKTAIMGGGKVWVPLGTPASCDPSTETYASM